VEDKKVVYNRRHGKAGDKWTVDVGAMLSWTQMFGTSDKDEVEAMCKEEDSPKVQWVGPNEDTFLQEWKDDAIQLHPVTKEKVWFNHAQVFHWSTFPAELWFAFCRIGDIRFLIRSILIAFVAIIKYWLLGHRMALEIRFGDGTPISVSEMNQVRKAVHKNMVFSTWKKGDIMCIDNFSISHGRQPTYDSGRKVLVAWSYPQDKTAARSSPSVETTEALEVVETTQARDVEILKKCCRTLYDDAHVPGAVEATPNSSPDSTLNSDEAHDLKSFVLNQVNDEGTANKSFPHKRDCSGISPSLSDVFAE
jgi:hypothetical protein